MSNLTNILLVSLSLGLNNFAATIAIGLSGIDAKTRIKTAFAFGIFEAGMPIIGLLLGQRLASFIGYFGKYMGAGLLILTGAYTVWQSINENPTQVPQRHSQRLQFKHLLITGFALSIDNLVVGFALSLYRVPIPLTAGIIAATSIIMSLLGLELGQRLGKKFESWSEVIGGVILIVVGLALGLGWF